MTDIEAKALALAIEVREDDKMRLCPDPTLLFGNWEALCRAIEQHEAFKQEVSDALVDSWYHNASGKLLERFIIPAPKPKPDPLVEVVKELTWYDNEITVKELRAALEARGLEIREKEQ
jgi:hypothetical protein